MNTSLKAWLGQVTTGQGVMVLVPTLCAALTGSLGWEAAAPLLMAGVVGLLWPENTALKAAAQTTMADMMAMMATLRAKGATETR